MTHLLLSSIAGVHIKSKKLFGSYVILKGSGRKITMPWKSAHSIHKKWRAYVEGEIDDCIVTFLGASRKTNLTEQDRINRRIQMLKLRKDRLAGRA